MENAEENENAKNLKSCTSYMSTRTSPTQEVKEERQEIRTTTIKRKRTKTKNGKEKTIQMAAIKKGKER